MAALSWESLWQVRSTLSLGVSAWGAALTLAVTMGGMCAGSLIMGRMLKSRDVQRPLRIYAALEFIIGVCGLFIGAAFQAVEVLDSWVYASKPEVAALAHVFGIVLSLGVPTICMGATLPVLGLIARQNQTSISLLYGLNTFGGAVGLLFAAFLWIPLLGITGAGYLISALNIACAVAAWILSSRAPFFARPASQALNLASAQAETPWGRALALAFVTGFATFMLEVSWFRSMTAAFLSTTDAFAIMLAAVLVALALGAAFAPVFKRNKVSLGVLLGWAGISILLVTPIVERFDLFMYYSTLYPAILFTRWFFLTLYIIGTPVILLGVALPWLLDEQSTSRRWSILYGANTFAAIIGAVCAAWLFLPTIGFAKTSWLTGLIVVSAGIAMAPRERRIVLSIVSACAMLVAVVFESGVGRTRAQGASSFNENYIVSKLLKAYDGPSATISVVEYEGGRRILFIDGFSTTEQAAADEAVVTEHYMPWMGHMPMLLHPDPKAALVICFGTGQTANAVRKENPESLDIVDLNANVLKLADFFYANERVLEDPRVKTTIMDGRAYLRRTQKRYDVITLEPMPPHFAGVNALYSKEFYEFARSKLTDDGVIAQWLPFHLVPAYFSASISRTFQEVFPNSILWIDSISGTGILVGSKNNDRPLGEALYGYQRGDIERDLSESEVRESMILNPEEMKRYGMQGAVIDDDNQLLTYGKAAVQFRELKDGRRMEENYELLEKVKTKGAD